MKKIDIVVVLLSIILFFVILTIIAGTIIFLHYKKINSEKAGAIVAANADALIEANAEKNITMAPDLPPSPVFNPSSLDWKEVVVSAPWEKRDSHAFVVYKNKLWVMGGVDANGHVIHKSKGKGDAPTNVNYGDSPHLSDVWSSTDGKNWQLVLNKAPWGDRRSAQLVEFNGKMWLMGGWGPEIGYKSDVWSSEDGVNWKLKTANAAWPAREGHQLLVFQNKMWLIGGVKYGAHKIFPWLFGGITIGKDQLFNDVWYSSDGIIWKKATSNAGWSPRWDHASEVFDNKLWVIDGMDYYGNLYKDVWSSPDGINWTLVKKDPPFASRQGNAIINYQNRLWVVSRLNSEEYGGGANDVWYSSDGISWKKTDKDPLWTGREDVGVVVFKNRMWVFGGMDKNFTWTNDIWYSISNIDTKNN